MSDLPPFRPVPPPPAGYVTPPAGVPAVAPDPADGVTTLLAEPPVRPVPPADGSGDPRPEQPAEAGGGVGNRLNRLAGAVDKSRGKGKVRDLRKILNALGMAAIGFGIATVILGWYGASHSPYLFQEIPYLISGGLLGVALVIGGSTLVLAGWHLRQINESRRDTQAVVRAVERLEKALVAGATVNGAARNGGPGGAR
jgi:hypothetical protein